MVVLLTKCYSGDFIKKNKAGGACNTNGERERESVCAWFIQGFGGET